MSSHPASREPAQTLTKRTLWLMAAACGISAANIYYNQPLLGDFAHYFGRSFAEAGGVAVAAQTGYCVGMLFLLPLGDLVERRRLVLLLIWICAGLLVATTFAPNLSSLIGLQLLVGMAAISAQVLIPLATDLTPPRQRGHTVGVLMMGLLTGVLLARTLAGFIAKYQGWRAVYAMAAVLMIGLGIALRPELPHRPPTLKSSYPKLMASLFHLLKTQPRLWSASAVSGLSFGSFTAFWTTLSFLMIEKFHLGASEAGMFGIVGLVGAFGASGAGKLTDRAGAVVTVWIALALTLVAFGVMWAWVTIAGLIVGVLLMDLGVQSIQVAEQSKVMSLLPEAKSRLNTLYMVSRFAGGALGSSMGAVAWARAGWAGVCGVGIGFNVAAILIHAAQSQRERGHEIRVAASARLGVSE